MPSSLFQLFQTLDPATAYHADYDWSLVAISIMVAVLAAFVALSISDRISVASTPRGRIVWAGAGAISMGGGIWSMHFIGMLAFGLPCGVAYDQLAVDLDHHHHHAALALGDAGDDADDRAVAVGHRPPNLEGGRRGHVRHRGGGRDGWRRLGYGAAGYRQGRDDNGLNETP